MEQPLAIAFDADRISAFCRKWGIEELSFFGSVLRPGEFRQDSDVDVLVRFSRAATPDLFAMGRLEEELAMIFGRRVDVVDKDVVEHSANYIRRDHILASERTVYVAR